MIFTLFYWDKVLILIGIIILNEKGLLNLINQPCVKREDYYIIGLNRPIEEIPVLREGRSEEYLLKEREVLKYADILFDVSRNQYVKPEDIVQLIRDYFYI